MNNFRKNSFLIIKNAISKELADFVYHYFLLKRQVAKTLFDRKYISPFITYFGVWTDPQVQELILIMQTSLWKHFYIK